MACGVCEHCQGPVSRGDSISIREGYSYHKECHKCYVCSETDLKNAEIFKGVIFCSSCSQRIFQGCSTARQTKVARPKRSSSRVRRRTRRSPRSHRERLTGVIELAGLVGSTGSESKSLSDDPMKAVNRKIAVSTELALQVGTEMFKTTDNMKKQSIEMGTTTDVTQVLLTQIECTEIKKPPPVQRHSNKIRKEKPKKTTCSDLRIAELGASTEIANMALRKKSEMPVIIKSESRLHREESISLSMLKQESDISGEVNEEWTGSAYSTLQDSSTRPLMDRRIGSILKLPYKCFKRNILNRSSLISVLISNSSSELEKMQMANKLKILFREEITDHQRRGMKRLYSTINRRKTPYRMGWLNLIMKISHTVVPNETQNHKRCKHFRRSHSYRCMRAKVMRLAGPTKSELAEFREKVKNAMAPNFVKNLIAYNKRYAIMMSKACGSDAHDGESIRKHLQKLVK